MDLRSDDGSQYSGPSQLSNLKSEFSNSGSHAATVGNIIKNELSILEELELKFGAAKNKTQIIHALEHSKILHRIPLPTPNATTEQARKDFRRERVLLNEVPFIPDKVDVDRCHAFSLTLKVLIERMTRMGDMYDAEMFPNAEAITDAVMQRACRTGAGADSFFMVQKLLCVEGTFVTQRTFMTDSPIKIDVFVADMVPEAPEMETAVGRGSSKKAAAPPIPGGYKALFPHHPHHHQHHLQHHNQHHHPQHQQHAAPPPQTPSKATAGIALGRSASTDPQDPGTNPLPAPAAAPLNNNSSSSSTDTPPSTPPLGKGAGRAGHHHHIGLPSPLKVSLRNLGLMSASKHAKAPPSPSALPATPGPLSSGGSGGVAFTPPGTPSAAAQAGNGTAGDGTGGPLRAFSFGSNGHAGEEADSSGVSNMANGVNCGINNSSSSGSGSKAMCARVQVMNSFSIFDVSAVELITGEAGQDPEPWLEVEAVVVDETNFRTDEHSRKLQLIVTCPGTGKVYTSAPDPLTAARSSGRLSGRRVLQELTSWFSHLPHHHVHWRAQHGQQHGRLHHSASDLSEQLTPPGSTRSTGAGQGTAAPSLLDPADSFLAPGEAPLLVRSPVLPSTGDEGSSSSGGLLSNASSDSATAAPAVSSLQVMAELDPMPPSRTAGSPRQAKGPVQGEGLHGAAVAALLASSPSSTEQFSSNAESPAAAAAPAPPAPHPAPEELEGTAEGVVGGSNSMDGATDSATCVDSVSVGEVLAGRTMEALDHLLIPALPAADGGPR